jgi:hypothetical protein
MKVFISSVRRGLEAERDSLPGLIMALGHEPSRFEDFGAKSTPSREACLQGVANSDAYLLLLGPNYGHVFTETGQSATRDEWMAALSKGLPKLVFRKKNVEFEPEQEQFARLIGDYRSGAFYAEYTDVADLQTKVVQALRNIEGQPSALTFSPLRTPLEVHWYTGGSQGVSSTSAAWLELHVVPVDAETRSTRHLRELPGLLVSSLRNAGALSVTAGAEPFIEDNAVVVAFPQSVQRRWGEQRDGALTGMRVDSAGQLSLRWSLPADGLGSLLDQEVLKSTVASGLRLIGSLKVLPDGDLAIGIGLGGSTSMVAEGKVTGVARTAASMSGFGSQPVRVEPDEAVSTAALDRGADEVAGSVVQTLLDAFRLRP